MSITGDPSSSSWERSGEVRIDIPKDRDPYAKGACSDEDVDLEALEEGTLFDLPPSPRAEGGGGVH